MGLAGWRWLRWSRRVSRRRLQTCAASEAEDLPRRGGDRVQDLRTGFGPIYQRRYTAHISGSPLTAQQLITRLCDDLNAASPVEIAVFDKTSGTSQAIEIGDEYVVHMPGPWNCPVRVVERTPVSFRFTTLRGHLEAGEIEFRAREAQEGLVFTIESWARSGDRLAEFLYERLGIAKEMQLHMWAHFCARVAELSGGRMTGDVEVQTERADASAPWRRPLITSALTAAFARAFRPAARRRTRRLRADLHRLPLNFDPDRYDMNRPQSGWHVDDYRQPLPAEPPGPPIPGGSWETARHLVREYRYAHPGIIREVGRSGPPEPGRNMLLEGRFYGLRFYLGLRVGDVVDTVVEQDGRQARVWGWNYRTLEGHLERGQMDQEVRKWLDSGKVEFHIHAFSQRAPIPNPIVRLGFRLFGRVTQVRFYRRACRRMGTLTAAALTAQQQGPEGEPG
jgi:uncharacterized protein (UPF0548 family)